MGRETRNFEVGCICGLDQKRNEKIANRRDCLEHCLIVWNGFKQCVRQQYLNLRFAADGVSAKKES